MTLAVAVNGSSLVAAGAFQPLLRERSATLVREFGCRMQDGVVSAPPMQQKSVADGKSGSGFLVGGGDGVSADLPSSYEVLLKQLSPGEAALLPRLLPQLMARYASGSLLARFFGWVRYADPARGGSPFEAVLMDNVARPPPGIWPAAASRWRPFDMKGIRLYKNEKRFEAAFGQRGLRLAPRHFAALRRALQLDVGLLTSLQLVDYSYLLSVVASSPVPPGACGQLGGGTWRIHDSAAPPRGSPPEKKSWDSDDNGVEGDGGIALVAPRLIEACYCANASAAATREDGGTRGGAAGGAPAGDSARRCAAGGEGGGEGGDGAARAAARCAVLQKASASLDEIASLKDTVGSTRQVGAAGAGGAGVSAAPGGQASARWADGALSAAAGGVRCERVLVRLAIIDYLRQWRLVEVGEHVQKTIQRDLFARERAHTH